MIQAGAGAAKRRGTVVVFTAVSLSLLIGCAALAIDVGQAYAVKAELQRAADAAALAGVSELMSESMFLESYDPTDTIQARVAAFADVNQAGGLALDVDLQDIAIGRLADLSDSDGFIDAAAFPYNVVQVTVRRDASENGKLPTIFASMLGVGSISLEATATAAVSDAFSGYHPPSSGPSPLLPFTVDIGKYQDELVNGDDSWSWDTIQQSPSNVGDGVPEIWIYPDADINSNGNGGNGGNGNGNGGNGNGGGGGGSGGGNFGTLNIGLNSQGTSQLGDQIENGVEEKNFIDEIGTDQVIFSDDNGNAQTYQIGGNPGLSAGLAPYIEARIGDVVGFFLHDQVSENGSNAEFRIVDIRFGRLMEVNLTGNPGDKRVVIQPLPYSGPGVVSRPGAQSSGGMVFTMRLVR